MRHILKTIPFPRLRLAGDDTQSDPQCHRFSVIPGRSAAEGKGIHPQAQHRFIPSPVWERGRGEGRAVQDGALPRHGSPPPVLSR
jgi:hypothetical protein